MSGLRQVPSVFFCPDGAWVGDVIPFLRDGQFWLYFLLELRDTPKPGTAWALATTDDFVTFEYRGVALPAGSPDDPDFNAFTGSIVSNDDVAHLFYTGHNPRIVLDNGKPEQVVMHATSIDGMQTWVKHPELTFGAPAGYDPADWRDPFVFRIDARSPWQMLLAARHASGPSRRRGVVARCVSHDLVTWAISEPFWNPRRYVTHECPEVFQWGEWWYLVYSEFSERFATRYRMSRSPDGPWTVPACDTVDGRAFYAAKSVERDGRRFFVGWIASKEGEADDGPWQWAGTMAVLEAFQAADGTLGFAPPGEICDSFSEPAPSGFSNPDGSIALSTSDGYSCAMSDAHMPAQCVISTMIDIAEGTTECGILVRASADGDRGYAVRLEPRRQRMVFDRWPRRNTGDEPWQNSGDVPYFIELERDCALPPGVHTLRVVVDGSILVATLDDRVTLSARVYDHPAGAVGVFVGEGAATFTTPTVRVRR